MEGQIKGKRGGPQRYGKEHVVAFEVLTGKRKLKKGEVFSKSAFERLTGISRRTQNKFESIPEYRAKVYQQSPPSYVQRMGADVLEKLRSLENLVASLKDKGIIVISEGAAEAPEGAPADEKERIEPDPAPPTEGAADGGPGGGPGGDGPPGGGAIEEGSAPPGTGLFTPTDDD